MLRKIKDILKGTSDQTGSVLSVSLIVVAILSFSLATLTSNAVNLSSQTTEIQNNVENTNYAKKLINMAIADTKEFMTENPSTTPSENFFAHDMDDQIWQDYTVVVADHTTELGLNEDTQIALHFSYELPDGQTISRYTYYLLDPSNSGLIGGVGNDALAEILDDPAEGASPAASYLQEYFPVIYELFEYWGLISSDDQDSGFDPTNPYEVNFYFALATEGDLFINGGIFDLPAAYATNIYNSKTAAYQYNNEWYVTPTSSGQYPDFSAQDSSIFVDQEYQYCPAATACMTPSGDGQSIVIDTSLYDPIEDGNFTDAGDLQAYNIDDFFAIFDYDQHLIDIIEDEAPTGSRTLPGLLSPSDLSGDTPLSILLDYSKPLVRSGNSYYLPDDFDFLYVNSARRDLVFNYVAGNNLNASILYDGDLTINRNFDLGSNTNKLIVLGDLTIDMDYEEQEIHTDIIVTGDIYFEGTSVKLTSSVFSLGETIIDFDEDEGFQIVEEWSFWWFTIDAETTEYFTLMARDNLRIYNINSSYSLDDNDKTFQAFFYSEESILVDAVNSNIDFNGSMYARAKGETNNPLPFVDTDGNPIEGIFINTVLGRLNRYPDDDGDPVITPVSTYYKDDYTRFKMTYISSDNDQDMFEFLPYFEVTVVADVTFVDDEFVID